MLLKYAVGSHASEMVHCVHCECKVQLNYKTIHSNQTIDKNNEKACCVITFNAITVKITLFYTKFSALSYCNYCIVLFSKFCKFIQCKVIAKYVCVPISVC